MIELTIEEYSKLISDVKGYEIGFTICISLLAALVSALVVYLFFKYCVLSER